MTISEISKQYGIPHNTLYRALVYKNMKLEDFLAQYKPKPKRNKHMVGDESLYHWCLRNHKPYHIVNWYIIKHKVTPEVAIEELSKINFTTKKIKHFICGLSLGDYARKHRVEYSTLISYFGRYSEEEAIEKIRRKVEWDYGQY